MPLASSSSRSKSATTRSSRSVSTSRGRMSGQPALTDVGGTLLQSEVALARQLRTALALAGPVRSGGAAWHVVLRCRSTSLSSNTCSLFRVFGSRQPGPAPRPRSGCLGWTASPDDSPRTRRATQGARWPVVQRRCDAACAGRRRTRPRHRRRPPRRDPRRRAPPAPCARPADAPPATGAAGPRPRAGRRRRPPPPRSSRGSSRSARRWPARPSCRRGSARAPEPWRATGAPGRRTRTAARRCRCARSSRTPFSSAVASGSSVEARTQRVVDADGDAREVGPELDRRRHLLGHHLPDESAADREVRVLDPGSAVRTARDRRGTGPPGRPSRRCRPSGPISSIRPSVKLSPSATNRRQSRATGWSAIDGARDSTCSG